jgi:hypothetical protein
MDQELIAYLDERFTKIEERFRRVDERFDETNREIVTLREETNARFGQLEKSVQGTRVLLEDMHGELRLVAEGVIGFDDKLQAFRKESAEGSEEALLILRRLPPYVQLDGRIDVLESWRERLDHDPIEVIREKFGLDKKRG